VGAFLGETDDAGRMVSYGCVASVAVVGNEDGAHHVTAELYQALADVGFTIPASAATYWVGEAMGKIDYKDLVSTPDVVKTATAMLVSNVVHLAKVLQEHPMRAISPSEAGSIKPTGVELAPRARRPRWRPPFPASARYRRGLPSDSACGRGRRRTLWRRRRVP
jgi:hypothetical protein